MPTHNEMGGPPSNRPTPSLRKGAKYLSRLSKLVRPYWGGLSKALWLGVVVGSVGLVIPYLTKILIDEVYPTEDVDLLNAIVGGMLLIAVTSQLVSSIQNYYLMYIRSTINVSLMLYFFNHILYLDMKFYDENRVGEIMSRFGDISTSINTFYNTINTVFLQGAYLIMVPPILFILQWKLALFSIITIPISIIIIYFTGKPIRRLWRESTEISAEVNADEMEILSHVRTFKSMALEKSSFERVRESSMASLRSELRVGGIGQAVQFSNGIVTAISTAAYTLIGWNFVLSDQMSLGDFIAFGAYVGYLYTPLSKMVGLFSDFQQSSVNLHRMFEYLDVVPEQNPQVSYGTPEIGEHRLIRGAVEIDNVSFSYGGSQSVLRDVNLSLAPGDIVAVVGSSGSGKTTLLRLINRMYTPDRGTVRIDGLPVGAYDLGDLRRQVAIVWQEYSLLRGTLRDNLTMGVPNVPLSTLERATQTAQIHDFVAELPLGYDTPVAEWGASLSGGQRQRIVIARALATDAPILLLDEAMANVDAKTERDILSSLLANDRNQTIVYSTHRMEAARHADRICVMEQGGMVGMGSHDELMTTCPTYRLLVGAATEMSESAKITPV